MDLYKKIQHNNDNLYNNFNFKLKNSLLKIKYHRSSIRWVIILNDGSFSSCLFDKSIIIYNNKTFKPHLIIK